MSDDLQEWRQKINELDGQIIPLLKKRFDFALEIADIKKRSGKQVFDAKREEELFAFIKKIAKELDFAEDIVLEIYKTIVHESRRAQERKNKF